jgi:LysM repeat protein
MTHERPSPPPPSRPGPAEPWRKERLVQRVPAHLGETTREAVSPWIMIAGVIILLVVVCAVIFMLLGGTSRLGLGVSTTSTPTRTRTPSAGPTILPITLPPPTTAVPGPTAAIVKYKVKTGDNLTAIANKYKVTIQAIMAANGMKDDTIKIGEDLIIPLPTPTPQPGSQQPPPSGATPTPISFQSPPTSAAPAVTPGVIRYTVQRGDSLITIAAANGSSVDAIRSANQLDSDFLSIGQILQVPVGAWTPTPTSTSVAITTATPTLEFVYAAPDLLLPVDHQAFHGQGDLPLLSWTAPATLKSNEYYVVHIEYVFNGTKKTIPLTVKQGNSIRMDPRDYPGANPKGTLFSWYVVVVGQDSATQTPGLSPHTIAESPISPTRSFSWY